MRGTPSAERERLRIRPASFVTAFNTRQFDRPDLI
jgi:hypothetical protein